MRGPLAISTLVVALTFGLACTGEVAAPPTPVELTLEERVAAVAKAVDRDPASRDAALASHDLTPEAYEAALFEIAMDPSRTKSYEKARKAP